MNHLFLVAAIFMLLALNGLFVAAEFASISAKKSRLAPLANAGNGLARHVLHLLEDPVQLDRFVAACQIGITVTSLALGSYGQARVIELLTPALRSSSVVDLSDWADTLATVLVLLVLTILQVILAELVPKNISLRYPERAILMTVRPLLWVQMLLLPFIIFFNGSARLFLRFFGNHALPGHSHTHSAEEIVIMVEESGAGGQLDQKEQKLLVNTLELRNLMARQVMLPRNRILAASADTPVEELLGILARSNYSRLPLYAESTDSIVGMVHLKDLLLAQRTQRHPSTPPDALPMTGRMVMHPVAEVPDSLPAEQVMMQMQQSRRHLAVVIDEYGGTAGLITFEDLIEEIIGDFRDEFDKGELPAWEMRGQRYLWVRGEVQIKQVGDLLGHTFSTDEADTIGGLVASQLGRLPQVGDQIDLEGWPVRVENMEGNGIRLVSLTLTPEEAAHLTGSSFSPSIAQPTRPVLPSERSKPVELVPV